MAGQRESVPDIMGRIMDRRRMGKANSQKQERPKYSRRKGRRHGLCPVCQKGLISSGGRVTRLHHSSPPSHPTVS